MEKVFTFDAVVVSLDPESEKTWPPPQLKEKEVIIEITYPDGYETSFTPCDFEGIKDYIFEESLLKNVALVLSGHGRHGYLRRYTTTTVDCQVFIIKYTYNREILAHDSELLECIRSRLTTKLQRMFGSKLKIKEIAIPTPLIPKNKL